LGDIKGIVHFEINFWYVLVYPQCIQDVGVFVCTVQCSLYFFFLAEQNFFLLGGHFSPPEQNYSLYLIHTFTCTAYEETQWFQHSVVTFNLNVPVVFYLTLDVTYWY